MSVNSCNYLNEGRLLVGGLVPMFYFPIYWEKSSQLTNIFQRGGPTTNQNLLDHSWFRLLVFSIICNLLASGKYGKMVQSDSVLAVRVLLPSKRNLPATAPDAVFQVAPQMSFYVILGGVTPPLHR